jgi:signal transduction histidine kinase
MINAAGNLITSWRSDDSPNGPGPLHPRLLAELAELNTDSDGIPDAESWAHFVSWVDSTLYGAGEMERHLRQAMTGRSSFENLFRISPIPIMEQDYTELEAWMDDLRSRGVESLREYLDGDVEKIKALVPKIRIVAANPAAVRAVGLPSDQLIGPIDPRIVNQGSEDSWLNQLEAVWERRPIAHASYTAGTPDGATYDAESTLAAPVVDGEPDFARAVFTILDVTPHRNQERRMQDLVEAKSRFVASVSHEVRTPLTAILGFAQLLQEPDTRDEDRHQMTSLIVQHAQEVADIVEDLLVAARAEAGQLTVKRVAFDVSDVIGETMGAGGSFTHGVSVKASDSPTRAVGDPARVRQILRNLLTNAERYGGPEVDIHLEGGPTWVSVTVTDDGEGIPSQQWELIFDPYHRADPAPDRNGAVGIGLSISRQLAELMGGALDYHYEAGLSRFRLALPAAD